MGSLLIGLSDKRACREPIAGGKAHNLARLARRGFRIPPGFIIPTGVFKQLLQRYRSSNPRVFDLALSAPSDIAAQAAKLMEYFLSAPLKSGLEIDIKRAWSTLGGVVAVRSSMVGEDSSFASFSGQLDSFLNIESEAELIRAIGKCYASVFSERFLKYIREHSASRSFDLLEDTALAVLIQRMIEPEAAGIAFSADPNTGRFCVIIEAVKGLGDSVAGGYAKPDRYVIDSRGVLVEKSCADPDHAVLSEQNITELAGVIMKVSREMAVPQDIEWALDNEGFSILQTRPITSLHGKNIYSRKLAADMAPGIIKPLYFSTNIVDMTLNVFARVFGSILGPRDTDYTNLVKRIRSRVFANATLFAELFKEMGMPLNLFEVIARDESSIHRRPRITARLLLHAFRLLMFVLRNAWMRRRAEAFLQRHEKRLAHCRSAVWSGVGSDDIIKEIDALRKSHGETQWFMWTVAVNMSIRNKMLSSFVNKRVPDVDSSRLLLGYRGLKSLEPNRAMIAIADEIRAGDPSLFEVIRTGDCAVIRKRLEQTAAGRAIEDRFDSFMKQYGYLSSSGTDFTVVPWVENEGFIWSSISSMDSGRTGHESVDADRLRDETQRQVMKRLNFIDRMRYSRLVSGTTAYIKLREKISFCMSEDAYQMRRLYLALGANLVRDERLDETEDLFFLEFHELLDLVSGLLSPATARSLIAVRRTETLADADVEIADVVCGEEAWAERVPPPGSIISLDGIAGSAGKARGTARVVRDPSSIEGNMERSDILVVPFMDIGWTPLFASIGGIVAETGGQLSHSAIVAREYGLPAVVSVEGATRIIADGQTITIDGSLGRVYLTHLDD